MPRVIDQLKRELVLPNSINRIVSLVPSQTEFLIDLQLQDKVVGITKFCIHPNEQVKNISKIGGTKNLDLDKICALNPDIIIANKEENDREQIEYLASKFPVWISDIYTLDDSLKMMTQLGQIFEKEELAKDIVERVQTSFKNESLSEKFKNKRVAYFIWKGPYMLAGKNTFIDDLLCRMGFINCTESLNNPNRYPELTDSEFSLLNPDYVYLSSEPYPFKEKHLLELQERFPNAQIQLVDGEMFSWYGSRLLHSVEYFNNLA